MKRKPNTKYVMGHHLKNLFLFLLKELVNAEIFQIQIIFFITTATVSVNACLAA